MPATFTQSERQALLNILGRGNSNVTSAETLARALGYPTSGTKPKVRKLIKECIEVDRDLIGSTTRGFFMIDTTAEVDVYLDSLESRIRSISARRDALIVQWNAANPPTNRIPLVIT